MDATGTGQRAGGAMGCPCQVTRLGVQGDVAAPMALQCVYGSRAALLPVWLLLCGCLQKTQIMLNCIRLCKGLLDRNGQSCACTT